MKFSKEELVVLNVLKASHRSMSIMELSEKSCFHFAPKLRVEPASEKSNHRGRSTSVLFRRKNQELYRLRTCYICGKLLKKRKTVSP